MWDPRAYASASHIQHDLAKALIEKLALRRGECVLDIGCGDGKITARLHEMSGCAVGIDSDEAMITHAKEHYAQAHFEVMDARHIVYVDRFDAIFSNAVMHWIKEHESVAMGMYRALKKGGRFIVQCGGHGNAAEVFEALEEAKSAYSAYFEGFEAPYRFSKAKVFEAVLKEAGFANVQAVLKEVDTLHPDVDAFRAWLKTTWFPYIDRVPKRDKEAFLNTWVEAYLRRVAPDANGGVHVTMVRLEAMGWKR